MKKTTKKAAKKTAKKVTMTEAKAAFNACLKAKKAHDRAIKKYHNLWEKAVWYNPAPADPEDGNNSVVEFFNKHEYDII